MASFNIVRRSGEVATVLVDDADLPAVLAAGPWTADPKRSTTYALRAIRTGGRATTQYLHRFLLSAPKGVQVDHVNHNGLDNRRENIRLCARSQNLGNTRRSIANTSGLKGVNYHKASRKFRATISVCGKSTHLGLFQTAEEVHEAYKAAALKHFGEFARFE